VEKNTRRIRDTADICGCEGEMFLRETSGKHQISQEFQGLKKNQETER
jgi:hypothetical protein